MKEKIPCIKCNEKLFKLLWPYLKKWGYKKHDSIHCYPSNSFNILILDWNYNFGYYSFGDSVNLNKNRELINNPEEFLRRAAELKGFEYKPNNNNLKQNKMEKLFTTKERILAVAEKHIAAKEILKELFPETFEDDTIFCKIGSLFTRKNYPNNIYTVFKWNGEVRILNITNNSMWKSDHNIKVQSLKDKLGDVLTISEFKKLVGKSDLSDFNFNIKIESNE